MDNSEEKWLHGLMRFRNLELNAQPEVQLGLNPAKIMPHVKAGIRNFGCLEDERQLLLEKFSSMMLSCTMRLKMNGKIFLQKWEMRLLLGMVILWSATITT